jgi:hypothetical protein
MIMRTLVFAFFFCVAVNSFSQNLESYTASNGKTYQVGDTVMLGHGSTINKSFAYVQVGGIAMDVNNPERNYLPANYSGFPLIIKKIQQHKKTKVIWLTVGGGNIVNYLCQLEQAIQVCEVVPCNKE